MSDERNTIPPFYTLAEWHQSPPPQKPSLIQHILRHGHKLLISGPSKSGKSFLLMELAMAIAYGMPWLGFSCVQAPVLYVNLEIDAASVYRRFEVIHYALGLDTYSKDLLVWNLRGYHEAIDIFAPMLMAELRRMTACAERGEAMPLGAIIIDPVYKLMAGDENSAGDVAYLCRMFDKICAISGASVIFCHHYAKTSGVRKPRGERASGSGVFGRDPDAILELSPLAEFPTGFQLDFTLREFPSLAPKGVWFDYPLHHLDPSGLLSGAKLL